MQSAVIARRLRRGDPGVADVRFAPRDRHAAKRRLAMTGLFMKSRRSTPRSSPSAVSAVVDAATNPGRV
jgi:hypothetical protein